MPLARFSPPAFLQDFDSIPNQLQQWSDAVSGWFNEAIAIEQQKLDTSVGGQCQYYNQTETDPGPPIRQEIVWSGFPKTLRLTYGRAKALEVADQLFPLSKSALPGGKGFFAGAVWNKLYYRPCDEYCEWHVTRDPQTNKILKVTFSSEPPEYWQALHGDKLPNFQGAFTYPFTGDPKKLLQLYHDLVSPAVKLDDLICPTDFVDKTDPKNPQVIYPKGSYNPYNKWNSMGGIAHLAQPNNSISAEILLGGDATILWKKGKRAITSPDELVCCAGYGGTNRTSDPTIGGSVNELARLGAFLTIADPVGLYMDDLDMTGWTLPTGEPVPSEYWRIIRGQPGMIERAVFEVPKGEGFTVSDVLIAGEQIRYGGQIAEHIKIKLVGQAAQIGHFNNQAIECLNKCCIDPHNPTTLTRAIPIKQACPKPQVPAFNYSVPTPQRLAAVEALADIPAGIKLPKVARHRAR